MVHSRRRNGILGHELERRIHIEWIVVSLVLVLLTLTMSYFGSHVGLDRLNNTFYDRTLGAISTNRALDEIVIIAIDDASIDEVGYWPWRRAVHAQLLGRLKEAKAVGLDIVLNDINPAYPKDDQLLAQAIAAQGRVVLPLILDEKNGGTVSKPLPILARAASHLGSINANPDDDALIRSTVLRDRLASGEKVDNFVLAMLDAAGETAMASKLREQADDSALLISYVGKPGSFKMYPYSKVLNDEIPVSAFSGKYVLIGAWASGLGDYFPTPISTDGVSMAGVEILANGLQNALEDSWIHPLSRWQNALLALLPVLFVCIALRRFSPRQFFFVSAVVLLVVFVAHWLLMRYALVWVPPAASLIGVALIYPVWSWRSQEAALQHFDRELQKLSRERWFDASAVGIDSAVRSGGSLSARVVKLHQAILLLRQAARQREETLQFLSHDMRSPQNSILALIQLQAHSQTQLPQKKLLERVDQFAHKTLALVDGFVQLARAKSMEMTYVEVDIVDLLAMTCDERWPMAQQRNSVVAFSAHVDSAYVYADGAMLARAFGNLLDNAINYSPDGAHIQCRLSRQENSWLVQIEDQGRGISPEQQALLFTPFSRFNESVSHNPKGSGLGLAFVQTVVARHSGVVQVQSTVGQGSTFSIRLPVANAPATTR